MRIGEIAVVGPRGVGKKQFLESVCDHVELSDEDVSFGRIAVNEQLVVHFYAIRVGRDTSPFALDLVAKKILGYIALFDWYRGESFEEMKSVLDVLTSRYEIPVVVAANLGKGPDPVPPRVLNGDLSIAPDSRFTFCRVGDPGSVRRVVRTLLNLVIDKVP